MLYFFILFVNYFEERIQDVIVINGLYGIKHKSKHNLFFLLFCSTILTSFINSFVEIGINNYFIVRIIQIIISTGVIFLLTRARLSVVLSIYVLSYFITIILQYLIVIVFRLFISDFTDYRIGLLGNFLTILLLTLLLKLLPLKQLFSIIIKGKTSLKILLANIFIFITFVDFIYKTNTKSFKESFTIYLTCMIILLLINYIIIFEEMTIQKKDTELKAIKQESKILDELISEIRSKQHEYDNRIATISALPVLNKDYESLSSALEAYTNYVKDDNEIIEILHIKNRLIASFLFYEYKEFARNNKTLNLNIKSYQIETNTPEPVLVDILSIMITNMFEAIESGDKCELSINSLDGKAIIQTKNKGFELTRDIHINLFKQGYSTKETSPDGKNIRRGYGLYNLRKILNAYKGTFEVYNQYSDDKSETFIVFHIEV